MKSVLVFYRICFEMVQSSLPKKPQFLLSIAVQRRVAVGYPFLWISQDVTGSRCDTCSHYLVSSLLITANMVILFPNRANSSWLPGSCEFDFQTRLTRCNSSKTEL